MNKTRLNWIDWAKSLGIFIVVLCHIPQHPTFEHTFFCSFQMPLFFILSGYLHKRSTTLNDSLKKYWKTIIVPYLLFQIIFYPYWYTVQIYDGHNISTVYTAFIVPLFKCIIGIPINGVTWFLIALLLMKLYADLLLSKMNSSKLIIISCIIVSIARYFMYKDNDYVKTSFALDSTLTFLPFFFLGYLIKKYSLFNSFLKEKYIPYLSFTISLLVTIGLLMIDCQSYKYIWLLFYLRGISGSLFIVSFCMILNRIESNIIYTISSGTIVIFGLHWMIIGSFNFFLKQLLGIHGEIQYSSPIAMLIAGIITWINYYLILLCKKHFPIILGYRK